LLTLAGYHDDDRPSSTPFAPLAWKDYLEGGTLVLAPYRHTYAYLTRACR
jgi:hypothetical protein